MDCRHGRVRKDVDANDIMLVRRHAQSAQIADDDWFGHRNIVDQVSNSTRRGRAAITRAG